MMLVEKTSWTAQCLLVANQALEENYFSKPSACVALLISRNYRLLSAHCDHNESSFYLKLSAQWWRVYLGSNPVINH